MAKIKFGMMMTDARGKLGGQVFSKNKGGSYVRTKVTPSNPQTVAQSIARALFSTISQGWSALTESQRLAWNAAVDSWKQTDVFGDLLAPTGKQLYQRLNNQAQSAGLAEVLNVPAKIRLPDDIVTASVIAIGAGTITNTGQHATANAQVMLFATPPLTAGTKFVKNRLRNIYNADGAAYSAADAYTAYVAKFGVPATGDNVYIAVKYVVSSGQATPRQSLKSSVVA